jgi:hypothetical protein
VRAHYYSLGETEIPGGGESPAMREVTRTQPEPWLVCGFVEARLKTRASMLPSLIDGFHIVGQNDDELNCLAITPSAIRESARIVEPTK